ncbi:MAG TPA: YbjN domain-containing protein [Allosphingosinicella sp.]|uniref:YbjN domain-containing protein n=1 Tax=Allosphingosinicella sp. TaxID=2823234 RepID=UPI002EDB68DC
MRTAIAAALALSAMSSTAQAAVPRWNPKAPENAQVLPAFNYGTVEGVLNAVGARYQRTGSAAKPGFNVTFANGRKAVLALGACNADGSACRSLSMQSSWTRIANSTPEKTATAIQRFNQRYSFGKAYLTEDGRPGMQRYLTADYGFIRGNLAVNFLVFANQVDRFAREVLGPLEAGR